MPRIQGTRRLPRCEHATYNGQKQCPYTAKDIDQDQDKNWIPICRRHQETPKKQRAPRIGIRLGTLHTKTRRHGGNA